MRFVLPASLGREREGLAPYFLLSHSRTDYIFDGLLVQLTFLLLFLLIFYRLSTGFFTVFLRGLYCLFRAVAAFFIVKNVCVRG